MTTEIASRELQATDVSEEELINNGILDSRHTLLRLLKLTYYAISDSNWFNHRAEREKPSGCALSLFASDLFFRLVAAISESFEAELPQIIIIKIYGSLETPKCVLIFQHYR